MNEEIMANDPPWDHLDNDTADKVL